MTVDWDEQAVLYAKENCEGSSISGLERGLLAHTFIKNDILTQIYIQELVKA